jgi:hypothetical protein
MHRGGRAPMRGAGEPSALPAQPSASPASRGPESLPRCRTRPRSGCGQPEAARGPEDSSSSWGLRLQVREHGVHAAVVFGVDGDSQLLKDVAHVLFDGVLGHDQAGRDPLVGAASTPLCTSPCRSCSCGRRRSASDWVAGPHWPNRQTTTDAGTQRAPGESPGAPICSVLVRLCQLRSARIALP